MDCTVPSGQNLEKMMLKRHLPVGAAENAATVIAMRVLSSLEDFSLRKHESFYFTLFHTGMYQNQSERLLPYEKLLILCTSKVFMIDRSEPVCKQCPQI